MRDGGYRLFHILMNLGKSGKRRTETRTSRATRSGAGTEMPLSRPIMMSTMS